MCRPVTGPNDVRVGRPRWRPTTPGTSTSGPDVIVRDVGWADDPPRIDLLGRCEVPVVRGRSQAEQVVESGGGDQASAADADGGELTGVRGPVDLRDHRAVERRAHHGGEPPAGPFCGTVSITLDIYSHEFCSSRGWEAGARTSCGGVAG